MMRTLIAALTASVAVSANAGVPSQADVTAVEQFLAKDNSYSPKAKAEAHKLASKLGKYIDDPPRFELEVTRIVALADNGHTALFPPQWTLRYPRSPVRLGLFSDGLFIIAAPAEHAAAIGKPVATINGMPWQEVRRRYSALQGGTQGLEDQYFAYFAETPALLAADGIGKDGGRLHIGFKDGAEISVEPIMAPLQGEAAFLGDPMLREASPVIHGEKPLYLREPGELYQLVKMPEIGAAYIRIDAIGGEKLESFLYDTLNRLYVGDQRNIIVDLRFNMGGNLNRARFFAATLPSMARGGRVYFITSGRTFSAAISTIGYAKQAAPDRVTIVGEPVGDRFEFWAEGGMIALPGLGAHILTATERHNYQTGCQESDCHGSIKKYPIRVDSLQPDLPAPLTFSEFAAGRDPAVEAISKDIAGRP